MVKFEKFKHEYWPHEDLGCIGYAACRKWRWIIAGETVGIAMAVVMAIGIVI